jgi:import receptor subunit TOM70
MAPTPAPAEESLVERVQTFVGENRRIVIGAAVVAAVGVGYYAYSSSRGDKGSKKPKDRKDKKTPKKTKSGRRLDQPDGPILEERSSDEG